MLPVVDGFVVVDVTEFVAFIWARVFCGTGAIGAIGSVIIGSDNFRGLTTISSRLDAFI